MLCNTGCWSAGDIIPEEPGQHAAVHVLHSILISKRLYQKKRAGMMLYNTGSCSAGDIIPEELLYNTGSWSAGDLIPEDPGQHAVI